ncbi:hypothetical protein GH5_07724 [Leishmania sp. Ghana 2012 LV757]|uniref:hypothetical protein n=1 Tax=Leishmania sp. Ghana 2012 LV757 TaxID=2803181 RepID=UPI001B60DB14|nr:hypothetical protein GH5_07724 [Leishmania sp. Ghana 2012 LV757]
MSSDAQLDAKLTELLRVMVSRLPSNKMLPTAVVQQLLRSKYGDTYAEDYLTRRSTFIGDTITRLMTEKERTVAVVAANGGASEGNDNDDDSSSATEEDEDDAGDSEEDDDDEDGPSDSDNEDFDSDEEDEDEDEDGDDAEEPEKKKARGEEMNGIAHKEQPSSAASSTASVAERCKAMAECLRKLSYRVRAPSAEESLEAYLQQFLIAEFVKHGMDPEKYSKSDLKRYRIKREVELLQQDGASLSLDRRSRVGRGFSNAAVGQEADGGGSQATPSLSVGSVRKASMFLDDE